MKKTILLLSALAIFSTSMQAQGLKGMIKKATAKDSSGKTSVGKILGGPPVKRHWAMMKSSAD